MIRVLAECIHCGKDSEITLHNGVDAASGNIVDPEDYDGYGCCGAAFGIHRRILSS